MIDPPNYTSVDLSLEGFGGASTTQGVNKPIKVKYGEK
jgi:hypothetical protein